MRKFTTVPVFDVKQPAVQSVFCRKVKYLNVKGSLVDEHTVRGLTKAGKEVGCLPTYLYIHSLYSVSSGDN